MKVQHSAKSVQTTAEVSRKYYVLTNLLTCTHFNKCVYLLKRVRCTYIDWGIVEKSPYRAPLRLLNQYTLLF